MRLSRIGDSIQSRFGDGVREGTRARLSKGRCRLQDALGPRGCDNINRPKMWRQLLLPLYLLSNWSLAFVINTNRSSTLLKHLGTLDTQRYTCVRQQQWVAPGFRAIDCLGTLESLHKMARDAKSEFFEFVASGIVPSHKHLKTILTPFKLRTCEFSIVARKNCIH